MPKIIVNNRTDTYCSASSYSRKCSHVFWGHSVVFKPEWSNIM